MRAQTVPVPLTDRDRRHALQEEAAGEPKRMAEEMATERAKAIQSSIQQQQQQLLQQRDQQLQWRNQQLQQRDQQLQQQDQQLQQRDQQLQQQDQQLQQRDQQLQQRDEMIKRQQDENKRLTEQLQRLNRSITKSASAPPASANEHVQTRWKTFGALLEVSSTGKQFTWTKTRKVTLQLLGKELSWWTFGKEDEAQSCVIPSSVNIIFVPHKKKVKIRSYGTQHIFLRLFFNTSETAETWLRYLQDARQVSGTVDVGGRAVRE